MVKVYYFFTMKISLSMCKIPHNIKWLLVVAMSFLFRSFPQILHAEKTAKVLQQVYEKGTLFIKKRRLFVC